MPKGEIIEVNGVRYEAVMDDPRATVFDTCSICDYGKDHGCDCGAFCCEMDLCNYYFKRLESCK